jgi:hypothetical protein
LQEEDEEKKTNQEGEKETGNTNDNKSHSRKKTNKRVTNDTKKVGKFLSKEERLRKLIEKHENSTLNKERGLNHIRWMRQFLQSPTNSRESVKALCLKFLVDVIEQTEQLLTTECNIHGKIEDEHLVKQKINQDLHLLYALQYHVGLYALYAAQVKWHYPHLLGTEHIEMRDHVMHGIGHSYSSHLTEAGISRLVSLLRVILEAKPRMNNALVNQISDK